MESDIKINKAMTKKDREFFIEEIRFNATQKQLQGLDKLASDKEKAKVEKRILKSHKQQSNEQRPKTTTNKKYRS